MAFTQPFKLSVQLIDPKGQKDSFQLFGVAETTRTVAQVTADATSAVRKFWELSAVKLYRTDLVFSVPLDGFWPFVNVPTGDIQQIGLFQYSGTPGRPSPLVIDIPGINPAFFVDHEFDPALYNLANINTLLISGNSSFHFTDRNKQPYLAFKDLTLTKHKRSTR